MRFFYSDRISVKQRNTVIFPDNVAMRQQYARMQDVSVDEKWEELGRNIDMLADSEPLVDCTFTAESYTDDQIDAMIVYPRIEDYFKFLS